MSGGLDNIGNSIDGLSDGFDSIGNSIDGLTNVSFGTEILVADIYSTLFDESRIAEIRVDIESIKIKTKNKLQEFKTSLAASISVSPTHSGYVANEISIGKWGSFNASMSRFSEHFGDIRSILIAIASFIALTIILGGIKW